MLRNVYGIKPYVTYIRGEARFSVGFLRSERRQATKDQTSGARLHELVYMQRILHLHI